MQDVSQLASAVQQSKVTSEKHVYLKASLGTKDAVKSVLHVTPAHNK